MHSYRIFITQLQDNDDNLDINKETTVNQLVIYFVYSQSFSYFTLFVDLQGRNLYGALLNKTNL